jgi:hypothetical protein
MAAAGCADAGRGVCSFSIEGLEGCSVEHDLTARGRAALRRAVLMMAVAALMLLGTTAAAEANSLNRLPNGSFEGTGSGSLKGWKPLNGALSLASDGFGGGYAAKTSLSTTATSYQIYATPKPATGAPAGETFAAAGLVRSDVSGRTICLILREFTPGGSQVATKQVCLKGSSSWTAFPALTSTVQTAGDSLGFIIRQGGAVAGDSFEVDNLSMMDVDSTAPTAPAGLTATGVSSSEIDLVWQASTDSDYAGVWGYLVYRDGGATPIATLSGSTTSYNDTGLSAGTTHTYTVTAFDYAQNTSDPSLPATGMTQSVSPTALWHMDETSGTTMHDSVGTTNGTLSNVILGVAGDPATPGTAYQFNGVSSYVSVPSTPAIAPGSANISFTIHVQTGSLPTKGDYDLIRRGASPGDFYKLEILQTGHAFCQFRGDANGGTTRGITAGPVLNDQAWHTITCTKTSTSVSMTIDGTTYSKSVSLGGITDTDPLIIGAHPSFDYFKGVLDEASVTVG